MRSPRDIVHLILETGPSGLILTDGAARIVFANEHAEEMLGFGHGELLGLPIEVLVPDRFRDIHPEMRRAFDLMPRERPMGTGRDLTARRRDGSEFPVEIALKPLSVDGEVYVLAMLADISERKRSEDRQRLLIGELNHRIQNLFAVIQSVALSSLSGERTLREARDVFVDRLQSLGRAYTMMTEQEWRGAPLRQILASETSAFADRVTLDGVEVMVKQNAAQSFALLLHELTTNAVKYGALSSPDGSVAVHWRIEPEMRPTAFVLSWQESGGPNVVPPTRSGYGRKIIEDTMRRIGKHQIEYATAGLRYRMEAPLDKVGWVIDDPSP